MAIVLPQGNFNNVSAECIRREIMRRARILAVVGLHVNSFKPHTGTKTSVLFLQKWSEEEAPAWEDWYQATYDHEAEAEAYQLRVAMRDKLAAKKKPIPTELSDLKPPGDPPAPPWDYPIFFATSKRSGRDNSGKYAYLKGEDGEVVKELKKILVHDAEGDWVEVERERNKLDCDLDGIATAFAAWAREHNLDFFAHSPHDGRSFAEIVEGAAIDASEVWSRDLERTHRIDTEYYHPRYLELEAILAKHSPKPLTEICDVTDGNHFKVSDHFSPDGEHRYLRGQDLSDFFLSEANPVYIPKEVFDSLEPSHMKPLDLLLSIVGTIGAVGMIPPDWPVITGSCKLAILRAQKIDPYYLAAFWASKYGKFQAERNTRGTVQMGLVLDDFPYLQVPDVSPTFQEEVAKLVSDAYEQRQESKRLYRQAEQLLLDKLGLSDKDLADDLCNEVNLSTIFEQARLDAEFFEPKYERLIQRIEATGQATTIGTIAKWLRRGVQPAYIETGEIYVVKSKDIGEQFIDLEATERTDRSFWAVNERAQIRQYDVLLNSTGRGTLGRANCYLETADAIADNHVTIIRPDENCDPVYLSLYLNSPVGRSQSERLCAGSSGQTELYPDAIVQIRLFLPRNGLQLELRDIVLRAYVAKQGARGLLEQAKRKVEAMIETEAAHG